MDKNTVQEVDFHDIIEGIRPDAPPDLSRQKEKEAADAVIDEAIQTLSAPIEEDAATEDAVAGEPDETSFLTEREADILRLIASGHTSQQIADKLYLSLPTIKWYRKRMLVKFEASNSADMVAKAKERGLI